MEGTPSRVVLNFAHRCALRCEWCYVPFESPRPERDVVLSIIRRVAELRFVHLTLGGGDPFQYNFIAEAVALAKQHNLIVHLDTHGLALRETQENARVIEQLDILGLPLDGPDGRTHDAMRALPGHFNVVLQKFRWAGSIVLRRKINTCVTKRNAAALIELAHLVNSLAPWRWSIYQFWPLGPASIAPSDHVVPNSDFDALAQEAARIAGANGSTEVEVVSTLSRRLTYPLVHHDGEIMVHDADTPSSLHHLGSIFHPAARERIDLACGSERPGATSRYAQP